MAFQNFSFPQIVADLGLVLAETDLLSHVPPAPVRPELLVQVMDGADLAGAINTEKARSEFVIAPILLELRSQHRGHLALFSGIELEGDSARGLSGICDFVIARSPLQHVLSAPLITVVEAKNDNLRTGLAQCIAAMVAAQIFNKQASPPIVTAVYGAVTTGGVWKFLRLEGPDIVIDLHEYRIERLDKVLGILGYIVEAG